MKIVVYKNASSGKFINQASTNHIRGRVEDLHHDDAYDEDETFINTQLYDQNKMPLRSFNNTVQEPSPNRRLVEVETVLSAEKARDSGHKCSTIEHSLQENTDSPGMRYNSGQQSKRNLLDSELASPMHKKQMLSSPAFPGDFMVERETITSPSNQTH